MSISPVVMRPMSDVRRIGLAVGHSIIDEIRRAHLDLAKKLLSATDLPMPRIAAAPVKCGDQLPIMD
jgi:hypothetical protein